ncbi:putative enzyme related to lactoylglutathione lyase [Paenibacillus cellulosilyticus]|uniref:Putative enzyme related to lactoylglutathione lyase n=1 Tax=Paenibacillus cellulosilyticus TaxID=375489 RepID=A0A2V2YWG1_9BACL|nr:VOC family protein [Paenibacillus cellulosilyticus]PWW05096.1 putative enzyme related to lactoylglutathione lyase [Paenibacillus cellulosilyticus]QKS48648.1 VOC family protein [Paenibacillus cellulosilyticus]
MTATRFHLQVIEIPVRDVQESVDWYTGMFGLGFCFPYNEGDEEACLNLNGMGFSLIKADVVPALDFVSSRGERKAFFSFQVDNIHELYEEMKGKGADVKEMVFKEGGGYSFQFVDPNGNCMGIWGGWPEES